MSTQGSEQNTYLPPVIFGTSGLGNLYTILPQKEKCAIIKAFVDNSAKPAVFDSAGKYGAGLALESLAQSLKELNIDPGDVLISNKLGWLRTELKTPEPTFEPGVWKGLQFDAIQQISYNGILECYEQGNTLLGHYPAKLVSVHDPDEYLNAATDDTDRNKRYQDILDAYKALAELKQQGKVKSVGVGAKDWKIIERISTDVKLDWVMIANSMTVHSHPTALLAFMKKLQQQGIGIINSAVFNGGFLTGGDYYNYHLIDAESPEGKELYQWRESFYALCNKHQLEPAAVCVQFGLAAPGVGSIAMNTSNPNRVAHNSGMIDTEILPEFWTELFEEKLITQQGLEMVQSKYSSN
ncbi:aldo/keto reductase [Mucilaginibacter terrae]|uniref:aldo/keto reductase n=1 Tax=Mucilaginibacter terrae TaxID=1955052 RepID=UPI00363AF74E